MLKALNIGLFCFFIVVLAVLLFLRPEESCKRGEGVFVNGVCL